jgi:hypothetical protein
MRRKPGIPRSGLVETRGSRLAISKAFLIVFVLALISCLVYYGSRHIENRSTGQFLAAVFGTVHFCCIFFGPLYIYTDGYLRGVPLARRILASSLIPFLWMTKDVLLLTESHPFPECLYWYVNPLSIWMICLLAIEMGLGTVLARTILRRRGQGENLPVIHHGSIQLMEKPARDWIIVHGEESS